MTTTEKLKRIRARCEELVNQFPPCESTYGWHSTIAAIDSLLRLNQETELYEGHGGSLHSDIAAILAAWPDELFE